MIDLHVILAAGGTCLVGVASPGPNFLAVSHRATTSASREAVAMASGIAIVNVLWSAVALFGLGEVAGRLPWARAAVAYAGAAYLIWFGARRLVRSWRADPGAGRAPTGPGARAALIEGLGTNLANPKSMMFYGSVFTGTVPAGTSGPTLLLVMAVVGLLAFAWYGSLALALSRPTIASVFAAHRHTIERGCGSLLLALGLHQAFTG